MDGARTGATGRAHVQRVAALRSASARCADAAGVGVGVGVGERDGGRLGSRLRRRASPGTGAGVAGILAREGTGAAGAAPVGGQLADTWRSAGASPRLLSMRSLYQLMKLITPNS